MINANDLVFKKTDRYVALQVGDNVRKWICRIFVKKNLDKTLILHNFEFDSYECEYYFDEAEQLEQIKDLIIKVYGYCKK